MNGGGKGREKEEGRESESSLLLRMITTDIQARTKITFVLAFILDSI